MKTLHTLLAVATAALTRRPRPTSISASRCRPPASGPAGSLGIAEKITIAQHGRPQGQNIVLDDASDPTAAVANARSLISKNKWTRHA